MNNISNIITVLLYTVYSWGCRGQLPVQSVPITTDVVSWIPRIAMRTRYNIMH